jgi:cytochrome c
MRRFPAKRAALITAPAAVLLACAAIFAEHRHEQSDVRASAEALTGGNAARGQIAFVEKGCGGCHSLDGVPQAHGLVGPSLDGIAVRAVLAGRLENTPENMMRWIDQPQTISPGTAMPDLPLTKREQRDIAAFLYTRT